MKSHETLREWTKRFAIQIVFFCRDLPPTREGRLIGDQLFRAGTSVGANYRAVSRARSRAEFIAKMGIVLEEADETLYWLEIMDATGIAKLERSKPVAAEANEIVSMVVTGLKTAKSNATKS